MKIKLSDYINNFLPHSTSDKFRSIDGGDVAKWLESIGHEVKYFKNTGRNGIAVTTNGISVSTNGYVCITNCGRGCYETKM